MEQKYDENTIIEVYKKFKTAKGDEVNQLDIFLKNYEKSMDAWRISQAILMNPDIESSMLLQAARTLKRKIEYDFAQLPQNDYVQQIGLLVGNITITLHQNFNEITIRAYQTHRFETPEPAYAIGTRICLFVYATFRNVGKLVRVFANSVRERA